MKQWPRIFHTVKTVFSCFVSIIVLIYLIPLMISLIGVVAEKKILTELPFIWPVTIGSVTTDLAFVSIFIIILAGAGIKGWVTFDRTKQ